MKMENTETIWTCSAKRQSNTFNLIFSSTSGTDVTIKPIEILMYFRNNLNKIELNLIAKYNYIYSPKSIFLKRKLFRFPETLFKNL
jgi:hypothetical protein